MSDDLLKKYFGKYGEFPPLLQTMDYDNEFYQNLLKKAIERGKPIVEEDLDVLDYDLVAGKQFSKFGK